MSGDLVYDVGMHNGDDTAYYLHLGFRVVAIDANPAMIAAAERRFAAEIQAGRLTLLQVGIGADYGVATFYVSQRDSQSSSFHQPCAMQRGDSCKPIEVRTVPFQSIVQQHGRPHYLKIDIEGSDRVCLQSLAEGDCPPYVSCEMTDVDLIWLLRSLGYDQFKLVEQRRHEAVAAPSPDIRDGIARRTRVTPVGRWVARQIASVRKRLLSSFGSRRSSGFWRKSASNSGWRFPFGSSGPFGEHAAGPWIGAEEAAARWTALVQHCDVFPWCDLHARHASIGQAETLRAA